MNFELETSLDGSLSQEVIENNFIEIIERSGLAEKLHPIAYAAADHYVNNDLYHNLAHMFEVTFRALDLSDHYHDEFNLTDEDRQALVLAALWHDADYHLELEPRYESKENRSAHLLFDILKKIPAENEFEQTENELFAGKAAHIILSTEPERQVQYGTVEWLMNMADLDNLAQTKQDALASSARLFIENLIFKNLKVRSPEQVIHEYAEELLTFCYSARYHLGVLATNKSLPDEIKKQIANLAPEGIRNQLRKLPFSK